MNSEPCVRFGIRISPKISEKPADRRNSRPPKVTLLTVSTNQKVIAAGIPACGRGERRALWSRSQRPHSVPLLLQRRVVARIDRLRQELLLVVSPELAHVVIGLHRLVPELEPVLRALFAELADVEVADDVAKVIELHDTARGVGQID